MKLKPPHCQSKPALSLFHYIVTNKCCFVLIAKPEMNRSKTNHSCHQNMAFVGGCTHSLHTQIKNKQINKQNRPFE